MLRDIFLVAMIIGIVSFVVARMINEPEPSWGELTELHAAWGAYGGDTLAISVKFIKRQECRRIIIKKWMQRIENDVVQPNTFPLVGQLAEKMQAASVGESTLFDRARISDGQTLSPGHYQLTIEPSCEPKDTQPPGQLLDGTAAQAIVIVTDVSHPPER